MSRGIRGWKGWRRMHESGQKKVSDTIIHQFLLCRPRSRNVAPSFTMLPSARPKAHCRTVVPWLHFSAPRTTLHGSRPRSPSRANRRGAPSDIPAPGSSRASRDCFSAIPPIAGINAIKYVTDLISQRSSHVRSSTHRHQFKQRFLTPFSSPHAAGMIHPLHLELETAFHKGLISKGGWTP
jgi:hypothetical protein